MKKNWLAILMLLAISAPILYAVTARQLYRVDYDATRDGNTYTYVDRVAVGVSTAIGRQYIIHYGTGSTIWKGFNTSVEVTTAGIKINGVAISSGGPADYDGMYLRISSGPTIEAAVQAKLAASSGPVLEALINGRLNASSGPAITANKAEIDKLHLSTAALQSAKFDVNTAVYSTGSICVVFGDSTTTAGNLVGFMAVVDIPADIICKSFSMRTPTSGGCTITISSAALAAHNFVNISSGEALSSGTDYTNLTLGAWSITTIPAGCQLKFTITAAATITQISANLKYWKKLW